MDRNTGNSVPPGDAKHRALSGIVKGGSIIFMGMVFRLLFQFILQIIIINYISQSEFGLFSLALAITNVLAIICQLGFNETLPAYVSAKLKKGGGQEEAMAGLRAGFFFTSGLSLGLAILLFLFADSVSRFLGHPELTPVLHIFAFIIPLKSLSGIFRAALRAYGLAFGVTLFQDILRPVAAIMMVLAVVLLGMSFNEINIGIAASFIISTLGLGFYARAKLPRFVLFARGGGYREALYLALPMLGAGLSVQMLIWTDTFMINWFGTSKDVGLYNGILLLKELLLIPLLAIMFTYLPMASRLFAGNNLEEVQHIYVTVTKWALWFSLPMVFLFLSAPDMVLGLVLGPEFVPASTTFQLIILAFLAHIATGPNGQTLVALGKTQTVFFVRLITVVLNVCADILLVPRYGIAGAGAATLICMIFSNALLTYYVYKLCGIHPFTATYLRLIGSSTLVALLMAMLVEYGWLAGPLLLGFSCILSVPLIVILSRSFDMQDAEFLAILESKITGKQRLVSKLFPIFKTRG